MSLNKILQEKKRFRRNLFFGGVKRQVYDRLASRYFLEHYNHAMITRSYLRCLLYNEIDCPVKSDIIENVDETPINKRILYVLLERTNANFGLNISALPSKKWMIAALNATSPNHELVIFLRIKNVTLERVLNIDEQLQELHDYRDILNVLNNKKTEWERTIKDEWNILVKMVLIYHVDLLQTSYSFLNTADNLIQYIN